MELGAGGVVVRSTGSWYEVRADDGALVRCRIRGRLRLAGSRATNPVAVGDRVRFEPEGGAAGGAGALQGAIFEIEPRRNCIARRASNLSREAHVIAANIDRALLLVTVREPATPLEFVDRFLVACQAYRVSAVIALAKADLLDAAEVEAFRAVYAPAGYPVIALSTRTGEGLEQIRALVGEGTTLLAGNSGVGKSTLAGVLEPGLDIRTGAISESHGKGRHTTTHAAMYPLTGGGALVDTPGIKGFGLIEIGGRELWHYFPEMMRLGGACRFYNCTHTHEPGCAVREAVRAGGIAPERYESYLKMREEDDKHRQ